MAREMQTVVVSKEVAPTRREAEALYRRMTRREPRTARETSTSWRFAQFDEEQCSAEGWASQEIVEGVTYVWCDRRVPRG